MSGGSFHYIAARNLEEAIEEGTTKDMAHYLEALATGSYGQPPMGEKALQAAQQLRRLEKQYRDTMAQLTPAFDSLREVMHAAEWLRSNDWGPEQLRKALEKWSPTTGSPPEGPTSPT